MGARLADEDPTGLNWRVGTPLSLRPCKCKSSGTICVSIRRDLVESVTHPWMPSQLLGVSETMSSRQVSESLPDAVENKQLESKVDSTVSFL